MYKEIIKVEKLIFRSKWNNEDAPYLREKLIEYNMQFLSNKEIAFVNEEVCITVHDEKGSILGGISGNTKLHCLFIQFLWIDESLRGKGIGAKLLKTIEELAIEKGCKMVRLDTFSFQAPEFYKKQGYEVYGTVEDFPEGYTHYMLLKRV
ncbi:GNAT family N-acetyltransferase [Heyndrickxia camelliae]|uniref:GNAT family N-acetyltransferase n=1 Tax=Heyndrickxia camelliae TaxID=1707093 RepID=A0A2N3LHY7_9BACI|nr:GNAT family N-acetyltransferase [Heyndrickxia camelliae]PKR84185.1 GNAT family N-acetyltransferase [Heyndrickxia camelliae]